MSFLNPALLFALPLMTLPIIIHLINQRRFQTVRWGAMMFLLAANRMSRGYARLRQYLIMAMRMAAIGGLIFAVSRPLAGGLLGLTLGGKADTTILILDRSASMSQGAVGAGGTKLETGLRQIIETLKTVGSTRWVLIENATASPKEIGAPETLANLPETSPTSTSADLPGMLQASLEYIKTNRIGRCEIWICSDLRTNDWKSDDGRWKGLREAFLAMPQGVRFHLLAYPDQAPDNLSIRVTETKRVKTTNGTDLLISLKITRQAKPNTDKRTIPIQFTIDGARSEVTVEMTGNEFELKGHKIALEKGEEKGWGKVSLPADANLADNDYWFAFSEPPARRTVIVAEDPRSSRSIQVAAEISPDSSLDAKVEVVTPGQLAGIDWDTLSLLIWQAPLPESDEAKLIEVFVDRGGQILAFPADDVTATKLFGVGWGDPSDIKNPVTVENWRSDQDLLANTLSGASLPVGELQVRAYRLLEGDFTPLATLTGGSPLLARATSLRGGVYFCTAKPDFPDSSLAVNGVVLYVMTQRAIAIGASSLGASRQLLAGEPTNENPMDWTRIAGAETSLSTDFLLHAGVYGAGDRLLALNRPPGEDISGPLENEQVANLFEGLDFGRVDEQAGSFGSLVQEVWRLFLMLMMIALVVEAALSLPRLARGPVGVPA